MSERFFAEETQMDWLEEVRARAKRRNKVLFMPADLSLIHILTLPTTPYV